MLITTLPALIVSEVSEKVRLRAIPSAPRHSRLSDILPVQYSAVRHREMAFRWEVHMRKMMHFHPGTATTESRNNNTTAQQQSNNETSIYADIIVSVLYQYVISYIVHTVRR